MSLWFYFSSSKTKPVHPDVLHEFWLLLLKSDFSKPVGRVNLPVKPFRISCPTSFRYANDAGLLFECDFEPRHSQSKLRTPRPTPTPLPRAHLVRYGGCLAPHSKLRAAIIPTPHQHAIDGDKSKTATPYWHWARLLGRVFDLDMATCPFCRRGSLQIIAAILPPLRGRREPCDLHQESVITRILRHLKLASVPPPITPARCRQEIFAFDDAHASVSP